MHIAILSMLLVAVLIPFASLTSARAQPPLKANSTGLTAIFRASPHPFEGPFFSTSANGTIKGSLVGKGTYLLGTSWDWSGATTANPCGIVDGTVTITSANGDTVEGDIVGGSTICGAAGVTSSTFSQNLNIDVVGGTGRFAGVDGSLVYTATSTRDASSVFTFEDTGTWTGSLSK